MAGEKVHIEKNTVQETLIIPLMARKVCTEVFGDFYRDDKAVELMGRLDYDFSSLEKKSRSLVVRFGALETAARQKACMWEVQNYLKAHPGASVVNLGCGLDQTAESCDDGQCRIYNVDMPDIIAIREQLIPTGDRVTNIAADMNDQSWFSQVERDKGAIFFATGVFYYFTQQQMEKLINGMAAYFHDGALVFDTGGKLAVQQCVKAFVKQSGIEGIPVGFYVDTVEEQISPWLKHGRASSRGYMTGYFDLREKSIKGIHRLLSRIGDGFMKMKIVKVEFDPAA